MKRPKAHFRVIAAGITLNIVARSVGGAVHHLRKLGYPLRRDRETGGWKGVDCVCCGRVFPC